MCAEWMRVPDSRLSRRCFLAAAGVITAGMSSGTSPALAVGAKNDPQTGERRTMATSYIAYVGWRTTGEASPRGNAINVSRLNGDAAAWTHVQLVGDLLNPSF